MDTFNLSQQDSLWQQLVDGDETRPWDLLIIGGGITGAGILREAARCGLRALLVEQQDFAWGTSSRSSKMVHGGLRYLAMGDLSLTRHSLLERERLLQEFPGLVQRVDHYLLLERKGGWPDWGVHVLLWLYDYLAGVRDHSKVSLGALAQVFPELSCAQLKSAYRYTDAMVDDARLVMAVLHQAFAAGAAALNYTQAQALLTDASGQVRGVQLKRAGAAETVPVNARLVINATGAWADHLRQTLVDEKRVRPQRGSHLVIPAARFPLARAITLRHPRDQRVMFVFPWEGSTVIGTTDLDHPASLDVEASITPDEVRYLLEAANTLFPELALTPADIISTWSGVRPIIASDNSRDPSRERRDHAVWNDRGLITVSGGKLTTFRLIARDVLKVAAGELGTGFSFANDVAASPGAEERTPAAGQGLSLGPSEGLSADLKAVLSGRYGEQLQQLLQLAAAGELTPLHDTQFCLAECRWALRFEGVRHLDDLLLRRTRLGLLLPEGGDAILPAIRDLCRQELHWNEHRWQQERQRYLSLWRHHYSLPSSSLQSAPQLHKAVPQSCH